MVAATCYSLRSNGCGYSLRSKGVPRPSAQNLQFNNSRCGVKHRVGKVSASQKKPKAVKPIENAVKPVEDMEDVRFRAFPVVEKQARKFANAAIAHLREKNSDFELVKPGLYSGAVICGGSLFHHNFKAKRANNPNAPVQTFFSQVFSPRYPTTKGLSIECCISLGKSDTLPEKRDNRGCMYCSDAVYHPIGGCKGIKMGWPTWSYDQEYEDSSDEED
ncbi:hypothetical protein RND81_10G155300 [Saponaria officinalis]|uniref:DUF3615 domain-containing protein n=1 Tax=Saponaria officinalis TaxID=3572 RepID=A0AAW1I3P3_SAPOF